MSRKRATLMIVDDNDMMRTLLRGILRAENYEVVAEARHGAAAVEQAQLLNPDIICMDVVMPEMDGLEALREIKSANPEIAVVMITGNASSENVQEAIQNGASGFIVKPFNAAKVLSTLDRVLSAKTAKTG
ncbi:MAG TPA: response regulator [Rhodocyclaceae bacterium]|jgi:two-component system chemotaxis response regulator CheY|nr:response regulator [Rhodocyclaceae bacterium]HMV21410.1 response regulator [Rhodocyclaceae bacterium]HNE41926.1 response regulator [Rhodocyclaceae bacterium]HNM22824.1 response regulator [Rhodocyclaceae bacterium]HNM79842.1 response regulator [Rhodocyclaceae bacterium]